MHSPAARASHCTSPRARRSLTASPLPAAAQQQMPEEALAPLFPSRQDAARCAGSAAGAETSAGPENPPVEPAVAVAALQVDAHSHDSDGAVIDAEDETDISASNGRGYAWPGLGPAGQTWLRAAMDEMRDDHDVPEGANEPPPSRRSLPDRPQGDARSGGQPRLSGPSRARRWQLQGQRHGQADRVLVSEEDDDVVEHVLGWRPLYACTRRRPGFPDEDAGSPPRLTGGNSTHVRRPDACPLDWHEHAQRGGAFRSIYDIPSEAGTPRQVRRPRTAEAAAAVTAAGSPAAANPGVGGDGSVPARASGTAADASAFAADQAQPPTILGAGHTSVDAVLGDARSPTVLERPPGLETSPELDTESALGEGQGGGGGGGEGGGGASDTTADVHADLADGPANDAAAEAATEPDSTTEEEPDLIMLPAPEQGSQHIVDLTVLVRAPDASLRILLGTGGAVLHHLPLAGVRYPRFLLAEFLISAANCPCSRHKYIIPVWLVTRHYIADGLCCTLHRAATLRTCRCRCA